VDSIQTKAIAVPELCLKKSTNTHLNSVLLSRTIVFPPNSQCAEIACFPLLILSSCLYSAEPIYPAMPAADSNQCSSIVFNLPGDEDPTSICGFEVERVSIVIEIALRHARARLKGIRTPIIHRWLFPFHVLNSLSSFQKSILTSYRRAIETEFSFQHKKLSPSSFAKPFSFPLITTFQLHFIQRPQ
jgi:hypothetical protein